MKQTDKQFINKLQKNNKRVERYAVDIEREETQDSVGRDLLADFKRELHSGLQDAADECLCDDLTWQESDERTQSELMRHELGRALANAPEFRKQYIQRQRDFHRRFLK
jgi:hypothetical protein